MPYLQVLMLGCDRYALAVDHASLRIQNWLPQQIYRKRKDRPVCRIDLFYPRLASRKLVSSGTAQQLHSEQPVI
jgi:hypothetical protein